MQEVMKEDGEERLVLDRPGYSMEEDLIFIHGAGGKGDLWTRQRGLFQGSLAPDLVGHPKGEGRRHIQDYASWVNEYRIKKKKDEVFLVGHSMGGAIAMVMALFFPYAVKGLVLMSTGAQLPIATTFLKTLKNDYSQGVEELVRKSFYPGSDERMIWRSMMEMQKTSPRVTCDDFLACQEFQLQTQVKKIQKPTLILVGEDDILTPPVYSSYLASQIKGSRLHVLPQAGHMLMLEKYREVNQLMKEFFQEREK